jgi:stress response protein SCP2
LDKPGGRGVVNLPGGEFEGPFYINQPCEVIGSNTTLWSDGGCIVTVNAPNVSLKSLRIEIAGENLPPHLNCAIYSVPRDTALHDVEVIGNIAGFDGEEDFWGIPKTLNLGKFPANRANTYKAFLEVPVKTSVSTEFCDLDISPKVLTPGRNELTLTTAPIREGSYIYGEVLLLSAVKRRFMVSGSADALAVCGGEDAPVIFEPPPRDAWRGFDHTIRKIVLPDGVAVPPPFGEQPDHVTNGEKKLNAKRGTRIKLVSQDLEIGLVGTEFTEDMDIEAYAFMLGENGLVKSGNRLVFFGNTVSTCRSVAYMNAPNKRLMIVNTKTIPNDVSQIDFVFSVYGDNADVDFSRIRNPAVRVKCGDGTTITLPLEGRTDRKTVIAFELIRKNGSWELEPLGMMYGFGIDKLCADYGVKVKA